MAVQLGSILPLAPPFLGGAKCAPFSMDSSQGLSREPGRSSAPCAWFQWVAVPAPRCVCNAVTFSLPLLPLLPCFVPTLGI